LINIETHSDFSGEVVLSLRSMIGKLVQTKTVSLVKGEQVQELDLSGVPAGIYFVQLAGETSNSMYKVVKR